jgi:hypothetical protein
MKTSKSLSRNFLKFITLTVLSSVSLHSFTAIAQPDPKIINAYKNALTDSMKTESGEITNNLTIIDNPQANSNLYWDKQGRVLVVTFTKYPEFDLAYSDGTWVTVVPKLKSFCTAYKSQHPSIQNAQLNQRIEQILGIVPESGKTYIVEFWVDPAFLKRPAISPDIKKVEISNPDFFKTGNKDTFSEWLNQKLKERKDLQNKLNLPTSEPLKQYPWTGLGYTFDWASRLNSSTKEFGLSELVIWGTKDQILSSGKVSPVEVNRVFTTEQYCKPDNSL